MTPKRTLMILSVLVPGGALAAPAPQPAPASQPAPAPVQRLSDEQVEQVLADAAARREAAEVAKAEAALDAPIPIQGQVGFEVGTGGHRAAFGSAFVPLGNNSGATVTFVTQSGPGYYGRRRR